MHFYHIKYTIKYWAGIRLDPDLGQSDMSRLGLQLPFCRLPNTFQIYLFRILLCVEISLFLEVSSCQLLLSVGLCLFLMMTTC